MKWLLDTNVVSESVKSSPRKSVIDWIAQHPASQAAISAVTLAELRLGVQTTADPKRRVELTRWLEQEVAISFADRTLPVTTEILIEWLQLGRRTGVAGKTRAPADLLIAATARVHDLIVVSRNVRDFAGTGILLYDPWSDKTHDMDLA